MTTAAIPVRFAAPAYAPSLRWLHWGIALLIFAAIGLGVAAIYTPRGPLRVEMLGIHKSIGVTVLVLVALRIVVRVVVGAPDYRPRLDAFTRFVSTLGHLALYVLMIALPVSGYVHSSAGNHPFDWFGLFPVPQFVQPDKALDDLAGDAHYIFAWGIGALLLVHVGAAIWHRVAKQDGVLERMWPRG